MSDYRITSLNLDQQTTAVMRGEMPFRELGSWLADCYCIVEEHLRESGMEAVGPPFARFALLGDLVAIEAGFPVGRAIAGNGWVEPSALPAGPAAVTTHFGRYEDVEAAYKAVHCWLEAHGYVDAGPHWEVYFTGPETEPDPRRWRTDVVVPYRTLRPSRER